MPTLCRCDPAQNAQGKHDGRELVRGFENVTQPDRAPEEPGCEGDVAQPVSGSPEGVTGIALFTIPASPRASHRS